MHGWILKYQHMVLKKNIIWTEKMNYKTNGILVENKIWDYMHMGVCVFVGVRTHVFIYIYIYKEKRGKIRV